MKKLLVLLTVLLCSIHSNAQSFSLKLDHYTILVQDTARSGEFYRNILNFKQKETHWGDDLPLPGLFLDIGNNQELHVTENKTISIKLHKIVHFAFSIKDFDGYLKFLDQEGIEYGDWSGKNKKFQTRIDGVKQIYFQDPDGYWIEVNDNNQEKAIPILNPALDPLVALKEFINVLSDTLNLQMYELTVEPGDSIPLHQHLDYSVYVLQGGKFILYVDGSDPIEYEIKAGRGSVNGPLVDAAKNTGETTIKLLITEIHRPRE